MVKKKSKPHLSRKTFLLLSLSALFLLAVILIFCRGNQDIEQYLQKLPQAEWQRGTIELTFRQPIDHKHPSGPKFNQRVVINHIGNDRPVVVLLEGYNLHSKKRCELAELLNANQIIIEHRFFAESRPDSINWKHLNIWQAATDHHKIINSLKDLYRGKWVTTGVSKGGMATMFHRRFYSKDVDASVAYVAPLNLTDLNKRLRDFFEQVGTPEIRAKIRWFQKHLLANKKDFLPLFENYAIEHGYKFSMGMKRAYEMTVLAYPFVFWQYGRVPASNIPGKMGSLEEKFHHLVSVSPVNRLEEKSQEEMRPFFYQCITQIGAFEYPANHLKQYLSDTTALPFDSNLWEHEHITYDTTAMRDIHDWLKKHGDQMMYLYGEQDPWTAMAFAPSEKTDAVKFLNPEGSHRTDIKSFPLGMQDSIISVLERWLEMEIETP